MKSILINGGKGKMGQALARLIEKNPSLGLSVAALHEAGDPLPPRFDCVIDFSSPQGAQEAFYLAREKKKPFLTGTTNLPETFLFQMQEEDKIPVFYAPNVSLSVYFFTELAKTAARMFPGYEVALHEVHHIHKKDAPSGTAKKLANTLHQPWEKVTYERIGETVGTHRVTFSCALDAITLEHKALNRDLFADSALHIALWLMQREAGFYTMSDYAKFKLKEKQK